MSNQNQTSKLPTQIGNSRRAMLDNFSERAPVWDSDLKRKHLIADVAKALRGSIPIEKHWRVLDYGCGTGALAFELLPYVGEITAADASAGMVKVAASKRDALVDAELQAKLDVRLLDLVVDEPPAEEYDLVVACLVMHHIEAADSILAAFGSLLKDGGWLAIVEWELVANPRPTQTPHVITRRTPDDWAFELSKALQPEKVSSSTVHHFERDDGTISPAILITAGPIRKSKGGNCAACAVGAH
jgi:SAM-dependent methyltransferase